MSDARKNLLDSEDHTNFSRRKFLGVGAATGALAASGSWTELFAHPGLEPVPVQGASQVTDFELSEVEISELQEGMASGRWSAREITEMYLQRIEDLDRRGPSLRAVIETNPDALGIARQLDDERSAGRVRGPLHGVPILVKDNVATADRMTTTAGALALSGSIPAQDAFVAGKLREAGAIILGKANLSEWANFRSTRSSSGWSGRGGQCRNPYALDRNPCGSSAGSGAAAAASYCAAAIGTETNGSIVCPAGANGLVGIKPTVGLVSRSRIIPISHTQDTAGPMARTVRDAALVLGALTGIDQEDSRTAESRGKAHTDYTQFLDPAGLRGARIGVDRESFGFHSDVDELMEEAMEAMRAEGAEIIDPVEIPNRQSMGQPSFQVLLYEFKAGVDAYLRDLGPSAPVGSLAEVIAFNEANRESSMPYFGQEILERAQAKGDLQTKEYVESLESALRQSREEGLDVVLREHRLDAIIAPTGSPAWNIDLVNGDHFLGGSSTPAAVSGYANITLPAGYVHGLPVGISFFAGPWSEPTLLRLTYAFEQATNHRRAPRFRPTAEVEF